MRHKQGLNSYLFYLLHVSFANEDIIGNGSIFNSVGKGELERFAIFKPEESLVERFDALAKPVDAEIRLLYAALDQLTGSRDALLPRLISGKLTVDHLDIHMPPTMQDVAPA